MHYRICIESTAEVALNNTFYWRILNDFQSGFYWLPKTFVNAADVADNPQKKVRSTAFIAFVA